MALRGAAPSPAGPVTPASAASAFVAAFAVAVLILSTGAFFVLRNDEASSPLVFLLWAVAYGVAVLCLLDGRFRERTSLPLPLALTGFAAWALSSTYWSVQPGVSLRRAIAVTGTVAIGLFLAQRLRPVEVFEAVRRAALIVAVASLVLYALGDPRVVDEAHGTLRGVVVTKNTLGRVMAVGLIGTAAVMLLDVRRWRRCLLSALALVLALSLTDSAGGVLLAVTGVAVVGVAALWQFDHGKSALPALVSVTLAGLVVLLLSYGLSIASLLALTGRDPTLTGRTDIWAESLQAATQRPVLGAGFGAFWALGSSNGSAEAASISARLAEPVANGHNGLLDVLLDTGLVGVVLAALVLLHLGVRGVVDARAGRRGPAALRLIVLALVLVSTAAESGLLQENSLLTILVAAAAGAGAAGRARARPMAVAPRVAVGADGRSGPPGPSPGPRRLPPAERSGGVRRDGHRRDQREPVGTQRQRPAGVGRMTTHTEADPR